MIFNQKINRQAMSTAQGTSVFNNFQNVEIKRPDLVKGGVGGDEMTDIVEIVWI